jgi:hypothetical protein
VVPRGSRLDYDEPLDELRMPCRYEHRRVAAQGLADQRHAPPADQVQDFAHVFVARPVWTEVGGLGRHALLQRVPLGATPGEPVEKDRAQQR